MVSREESAASTRRALLDAAAALLGAGGVEAVTLREVGARAGVSRGAPYRHFADKESLLTAIASEAWERVGTDVSVLRTSPELSASEKLRAALSGLIAVGREQPHLYRLMFTQPSGDPTAVVRAAGRSQDEFLAIVAELVGEQDARRYGALLMASVHGVTSMEVSGHLTKEKWGTSAEELIEMLVGMVAAER
ncbi:TetR/AcrR family transcriptional regulator [Cryptosporangium arvum]|uniref:TetR/AcrR family transcriptional regulator n=1 Tax=Cryptosporangium arvum TaxID=80871 RepID=UPI0004B1C053|nr:TetR/AcrR family transcriptional regulator [Cryptosporangium arvum]